MVESGDFRLAGRGHGRREALLVSLGEPVDGCHRSRHGVESATGSEWRASVRVRD
jgi:hypothetical protein